MNKYRIGTDIPFRLSIIDSGVQLDFTEFTVKKVALYSDSQASFAGACTFGINSGDSALLDCTYPAAAQVYTGALRLVVILERDGSTLAYDLADVFALVATSDEVDMSDGDVISATLTVSALPMSTITLILDACVAATEEAVEAATMANDAAGVAEQKAAEAESAAAVATAAAAAASSLSDYLDELQATVLWSGEMVWRDTQSW